MHFSERSPCGYANIEHSSSLPRWRSPEGARTGYEDDGGTALQVCLCGPVVPLWNCRMLNGGDAIRTRGTRSCEMFSAGIYQLQPGLLSPLGCIWPLCHPTSEHSAV